MSKIMNTRKSYALAIQYKDMEDIDYIKYYSIGGGTYEFSIDSPHNHFTLEQAKLLKESLTKAIDDREGYINSEGDFITLEDSIDPSRIENIIIVEIITETIVTYFMYEELK